MHRQLLDITDLYHDLARRNNPLRIHFTDHEYIERLFKYIMRHQGQVAFTTTIDNAQHNQQRLVYVNEQLLKRVPITRNFDHRRLALSLNNDVSNILRYFEHLPISQCNPTAYAGINGQVLSSRTLGRVFHYLVINLKDIPCKL